MIPIRGAEPDGKGGKVGKRYRPSRRQNVLSAGQGTERRKREIARAALVEQPLAPFLNY